MHIQAYNLLNASTPRHLDAFLLPMQRNSQYQLHTVRLPQIMHTLPPMPAHECAYLPGQVARDSGFSVSRLDPAVWEFLLEQGWRRAGGMIYEPVCPFCNDCIPLRIFVADFKPNRAQRRCLTRNSDLTAKIVQAHIDDERADLYRKYMHNRHDGMMSGSRKELEQFLGLSPVKTFEIEIRQWRQNQNNENNISFSQAPLLAVMVLDESPRAWSAVYCYFDPDEAKRSLGTFAIQQAILLCEEHCPARNDSHLYLGYWVPDSNEMKYKANFKPHEIRTQAGNWKKIT